MPTIRLQTSAMKAKRARNERARRRSLASDQAALALVRQKQRISPAQPIAPFKTKKNKNRISGHKKSNASAQPASLANPKKLMIRIPGPKKANVAAQGVLAAEPKEANVAVPTASAGKIKIEEDADVANDVLAQPLQYKPTRLRFTPGKPAVMV